MTGNGLEKRLDDTLELEKNPASCHSPAVTFTFHVNISMFGLIESATVLLLSLENETLVSLAKRVNVSNGPV